MPYYYGLKNFSKANRKRSIEALQRLRSQLDAEMPHKSRSHTLILGTWNIRNFDDDRFGNGKRRYEDPYFIAEIISRFDVIAVQEVCDDLGPLDSVMRILGDEWGYIVTDVTEGASGNDERLGFIYDKNKVWFQGVAGEVVLPDKMQIISDGKHRQFARTPFMCGFQSGWFNFQFSTVHIYFGSSSGEKYERRVKEIDAVARFLAKRAKNGETNQILVGDFNIVKPGSKGHNALEKAGFTIVDNNLGSNKDQTKFYDQISFITKPNELRIAPGPRSSGTLQFFDSIFREEDFESLKPRLADAVKDKIKKVEADIEEAIAARAKTTSANRKETLKKRIAKKRASLKEWNAHLTDDTKMKDYYLKDWRTFHASDHLPLWLELQIDFSAEYLDEMLADC